MDMLIYILLFFSTYFFANEVMSSSKHEIYGNEGRPLRNSTNYFFSKMMATSPFLCLGFSKQHPHYVSKTAY